MALTKLTDDVAIIGALSDTPNATEGLTATQLKAKFDEAAGLVKTYVNDTLTEELDTSIEAANLAGTAKKSVINGNFTVWQEGTSFSDPATGTYTAEMYANHYALSGGTLPTSLVHTRLTLTNGDIFGSDFGYRLTTNGAGSSFGVNAYYGLFNRMENMTRYLAGSGKKVTVSFYAKSSIASKKLGVGIQQNYGTGGSPTALEDLAGGTAISLTTSWARYTVTFTTNTLVAKTFGTNNDDYLQLGFYYMWGTTPGTNSLGGAAAETFVGSGTIDIAQVQVNAGDQALLFQPRSFGEELTLCQRYFEKSYDQGVSPGATGTNQGIYNHIGSPSSATGMGITPSFKVTKRIIPTITVYDMAGTADKLSSWNGSAQTDGIAATTSQVTTAKFRVLASVTSGNYELFGHYKANARM